MFAHGLRVAQVMVLLHEAVEERLIGRASHLTQRQGSKLRQAHLHGAFIALQGSRLDALAVVLVCCLAQGRQLDQSSPMQHEHHAAAHHVAKSTVGLYPVPGHTQFLGQVPAAGGGVCGDEVADEDEVFVGDGAVAVAQRLGHAPQSIPNRSRTQAKRNGFRPETQRLQKKIFSSAGLPEGHAASDSTRIAVLADRCCDAGQKRRCCVQYSSSN